MRGIYSLCESWTYFWFKGLTFDVVIGALWRGERSMDAVSFRDRREEASGIIKILCGQALYEHRKSDQDRKFCGYRFLLP